MIRAYLKKNTKTVKITRDDCYNVTVEFKYDYEKYYTYVGIVLDTFEDLITEYITKGYTLRSIQEV